ncbi:MAG: MTAP family purine nucleoside phosphorylase [Phycisphaerales bacterium]|jgi:5'-methylthioadenosine phosphorylase|nr:MTAP family purine nucleoside phosphorylase [Phycisphaeraceae bacterium]
MRIAIIGGSGLEHRLSESGLLLGAELVRLDTPFGPTSAPIAVGTIAGSGVGVAILKRHGEGHVIPPHEVPYRANIWALKSLGVTHVIATGAVGSLREEVRPGGVMLVDQFIDRTSGTGSRGHNRTFFDRAAVHVEFAEPTCAQMRSWLMAAATDGQGVGIAVRNGGTYVCIDGPSFSTRAESVMHRTLGADVVGMTALPEARLVREAEMAYALVALPTDYDCWRERSVASGQSLLSEIIGNLRASADAAARLIEHAIRDVSALRGAPSAAHDALGLAIWTSKDRIDPYEIRRLGPIWSRHFV